MNDGDYMIEFETDRGTIRILMKAMGKQNEYWYIHQHGFKTFCSRIVGMKIKRITIYKCDKIVCDIKTNEWVEKHE